MGKAPVEPRTCNVHRGLLGEFPVLLPLTIRGLPQQGLAPCAEYVIHGPQPQMTPERAVVALEILTVRDVTLGLVH